MFSQNRASRTAQKYLAFLRVPEMTALIHTVEMGAKLSADEWNRLRWQCRRGLLELDLVLERFLVRHRGDLQGERLAAFKALLDYGDNDLLDLVHARAECGDKRLAEVVGLLRAA